MFIESRCKDKGSEMDGYVHSWNLICSFLRECNFIIVVPKCLNFATFSKNLLALFMILSCILVARHEHIVLRSLYIYFWAIVLTSV
jgi:hypothetical protein